jgi:hypothetical protein
MVPIDGGELLGFYSKSIGPKNCLKKTLQRVLEKTGLKKTRSVVYSMYYTGSGSD